jgi:hypothetical protein
MDDKTLIAKFAAEETSRINERLKKMVQSDTPPSEEERDAVIGDIEKTLARLQSALSQITPDMLEGLDEEEPTQTRKPS